MSNRYPLHARDTQRPAQLQKQSLQAGYILWLRDNLDENDLRLLYKAGLDKGALGHPVVVVGMLEGQPSHLEICIVWKHSFRAF